jgi:hypothetical protein
MNLCFYLSCSLCVCVAYPEHTNYWGVDPRVGPVLVSVAPTGSSGSKYVWLFARLSCHSPHRMNPRTCRTVIETVATFRSSARLVMNTHKKFSFNSESRNIVVHRCLIQSKHVRTRTTTARTHARTHAYHAASCMLAN